MTKFEFGIIDRVAAKNLRSPKEINRSLNMSVSGRAPSAKKFRRIELSTAHTGRKSSASVTLALCGIALLPLAQGCFFAQQDALPQGDLKYFSTTACF